MVEDDTLVKCNAYFANPYVPAGQPGHLVLAQLTVTYTPTPRNWLVTDVDFEEDGEREWGANDIHAFPGFQAPGNPEKYAIGQNTNQIQEFREGEAHKEIFTPVYLHEEWTSAYFNSYGKEVDDDGPNHGLWYNAAPPYKIDRMSRVNWWCRRERTREEKPTYEQVASVIDGFTQEDYEAFCNPHILARLKHYDWPNWYCLEYEACEDHWFDFFYCKRIDFDTGEVELCLGSHWPGGFNQIWGANLHHEGYGYGGEAGRAYGHQALIEDSLVEDRDKYDVNKHVEGFVCLTGDGLLQKTEGERLEDSDELYKATMALDQGGHTPYEEQHNFYSPCWLFYYRGIKQWKPDEKHY